MNSFTEVTSEALRVIFPNVLVHYTESKNQIYVYICICTYINIHIYLYKRY